MDINFGEENNSTVIKDKVTISKQQRNGRKCWTIIENFANNMDISDIKKFIKLVKKTKCCNGSYQNENKVIQLQGDQTDFVKELICNKYEYNEEDILVKGV
jgi:translation initiation factor SUI1